MSDYIDTREGWREITGEADATHFTRTKRLSMLDNGVWRHWVPGPPDM